MAHLAKDAPGIFVYKVEKQVWALYQAMAGPNAVYVNEDEFGREIRACVSCFYWEKERHQWVNRKLDDEAALQAIEQQVCVHLAAAAEMGEDMRRYPAAVRSDFEKLWQYVREWLGEESDGDAARRLRELLAGLRKLLETFE